MKPGEKRPSGFVLCQAQSDVEVVKQAAKMARLDSADRADYWADRAMKAAAMATTTAAKLKQESAAEAEHADKIAEAALRLAHEAVQAAVERDPGCVADARDLQQAAIAVGLANFAPATTVTLAPPCPDCKHDGGIWKPCREHDPLRSFARDNAGVR